MHSFALYAVFGCATHVMTRSAFIAVRDHLNHLELKIDNTLGKVMKNVFIFFGTLTVIINSCAYNSTDPDLVDKVIEIVTDDVEDLFEYKTGIDIDLNGNGK